MLRLHDKHSWSEVDIENALKEIQSRKSVTSTAVKYGMDEGTLQPVSICFQATKNYNLSYTTFRVRYMNNRTRQAP